MTAAGCNNLAIAGARHPVLEGHPVLGRALILYMVYHVMDPFFVFLFRAHAAGVRAPCTSAQRVTGAGRSSPGDGAADQRTSGGAAPRPRTGGAGAAGAAAAPASATMASLSPVGGAGGGSAAAAVASHQAAHVRGSAEWDSLTGEPYTVRRRLFHRPPSRSSVDSMALRYQAPRTDPALRIRAGTPALLSP